MVVIVVLFTIVAAPIVRPLAGAVTWTVVPAAVKPVPVRVTGTAVPRRPKAGAIEARVGVPGLTTVKPTGLLTPPGVVTVTFLAVRAAVAEMVKVAVTCVSLTLVSALTVMPPPVTVIAVVPVSAVPVRVTGTAVPLAPALGEIAVRLPGGTRTVNATELLVPPGAVTVTFLAPPVAPAVNASVAVTSESLTTVTALTATPPPDTLTAVVPVNPLPARVTGMGVPRLPEAGEIEVSTGPVIVNGRVLLSEPPVAT